MGIYFAFLYLTTAQQYQQLLQLIGLIHQLIGLKHPDPQHLIQPITHRTETTESPHQLYYMAAIYN